jgi:co-chaperonin GroES (HSP10)
MYSTDTVDVEVMAEQLPSPRGYKLMIAVAGAEKKRGGVFLPEQHVDKETTATILGAVVAMGTDAYNDEKKFPSGPWCKVGDFVMFHPYSGTRFKIKDQEFRFLNDDMVLAVIDDPSELERV